ncbi:MAG TPA: type II toxin-antitoxin system MqsA family antitoxin [Candidatus Ornithospirochaeta avicola]|uniref:Type II toxin-antitoxin system MqsA family antitoxin n=1 Tax=Candidatus Ornithospirochaeta avicola TaxID=2840896 RepID=A0A9D1PTY6_9SPIO|nr:type II toxin-antitoxin system MqsA family antitoxin [Candidatus Ornithospirochaeta avicola]
MCSYCRGKELKESTTTYVAVLDEYTIIIKNVPCLECAQCGEKYYTDEVMQNIERIVTKAKELNSEFFVAEYKAA